MRVQCDGCNTAEASVMCCADEVALCTACDTCIHAANKLASKHQRVALLHQQEELDSPRCDVCQEQTGYFFCLQDRALLCRACDYSVHSMNSLAGKHQRFLVLGIRVDLHALTPIVDNGELVGGLSSRPRVSSASFTQAEQAISIPLTHTIQAVPKPSHTEKGMPHQAAKPKHQQQALLVAPPRTKGVCVLSSADSISPPASQPMNFSSDPKMHPSMHADQRSDVQRGGGGFLKKSNIAKYLTETIPGWTVDELLSLAEMASATQKYKDYGSTKMDGSWSSGNPAWPFRYYNAGSDPMGGEPLCLAEVPPSSSPPTLMSGVSRSRQRNWGHGSLLKLSDLDRFLGYDDASVVPDVGLLEPSGAAALPQKRRSEI